MALNKVSAPTPTVPGRVIYFPNQKEVGKVAVNKLSETSRLTDDEIRNTRHMLHEQLIDVDHSCLTAPQMYQTMFTLRVHEIRNVTDRPLSEAKAEALKEEARARELGNAHEGFKDLSHRMYEKMKEDAIKNPRIHSNKIPGLTRPNGTVLEEEGFRTGMAYLLIQDLRLSTNRTNGDNANIALTNPPAVALKAFDTLLVEGNRELHSLPAISDAAPYNPLTLNEHENAFTMLAALTAKAFSRTSLTHNSGVSVQFMLDNEFKGIYEDDDATPVTPPPVTPPPVERPATPPPETSPGRANVLVRRIAQVMVFGSAAYTLRQALRGNAAVMERVSPEAARGPLSRFLVGAESTIFFVGSAAYAFSLAREASRRIEESENAAEVARNAALIVGSSAVLFAGQWLYRNNYGRDIPVAQVLAQMPMGLNAFYQSIKERFTGKKDESAENEQAPIENETTESTGKGRISRTLRTVWLYSNVIGQAATFTGLLKEFVPGIFKEAGFVKKAFGVIDDKAEYIEDTLGNLEAQARLWYMIFDAIEKGAEKDQSLAGKIGRVMWIMSPFGQVPRNAEQAKIAQESDDMRKDLIETVKVYTATGVWGFGNPAKRKAATDAAKAKAN